jgi:hypothetical protein
MAVKLIDLQLIYGVAGAREKFEDLAAHLVQKEQPNASKVRLERGDDGIDVHVGDLTNTAGIDVYQCKFFPQGLGESQKSQVRESFRRCRESANFKLKRWTLCLPVDLSVDEKRWFEEWKGRQASFGIGIDDLWTATKLEGLLYQEKNRGLKEAFFKEEYLAQIREMHSQLQQLVAEVIARLPNPSERKHLKIVHEFPASIVFNDVDNLPQVFFDESPVGMKLQAKSTIARPHRFVEGKGVLTVDVPVTDDMKFTHGVDALQCKVLDDICTAQRGGVSRQWVAGKGASTTFTTPNTPEPVTRIPGTAILAALSDNRFAQSSALEFCYQHAGIPFPDGTSIQLDGHPGGPGVGPIRRRVLITVPGKAAIVVSITAAIRRRVPILSDPSARPLHGFQPHVANATGEEDHSLGPASRSQRRPLEHCRSRISNTASTPAPAS